MAVERDLEAGCLFVWDDDGPGCCARAVPPVAGVCRIGTVYTPPERRRRGYAGACVSALCARIYPELANSTSNGIYRRLGFRPVAEVPRYRFGD